MKSFLQGKKALALSSLRPPTGVAATGAMSCSTARTAAQAQQHGQAPGASSATVEVIKEGDKVVRLIVTCVCGERVEVECLYPAGS